MNAMRILVLAVGASSLLACAHETPQELIDARAAYQRAEGSAAAQYAQPQLQTAHRALERAESEFKSDGNDKDTRDFAYIAERLSQNAESSARLEIAQNARSETARQLELAQAEQKRLTELAMNEKSQQVSKLEVEKEAERQARIDAERKEAEAIAALEKVGKVRDDKRGYVLDITGSLLFASGKSTLLKSAEEHLLALVDAVRGLPMERNVVIEGHTDSQGPDSMNQRLSEARAAAVKSFLVRHGIAARRLETSGMGESDPVADNSTPEGRAENRRVEIVIEKAG